MLSERVTRISPFRVMELMERAEQLEGAGHRVVHFEVGEPDFTTARPIIEAGQRALADGHTKYTHALGLRSLREAIARDYRERLGVDVPASRIAVTSGASGGLMLLCSLLLESGAGLLIADPGYPCNEAFVQVVGGRPQRVVLRPQAGYVPSVADLSLAWQDDTAGVLLASPANPTGAVIDDGQLQELASFVLGRGAFFILDEIYQGLIYSGERLASTGLAVDDRLFVLNSFSKYFGMTGWRLGWVVAPQSSMQAIERLAQNLFISPSSVAQRAALAAFSEAAMAIHEARRHRFDVRRGKLLAGLENLGFGVPAKPDGAFYLYVDVASTGMDSHDFCWRLIDEYQVAVTPGIDFGAHSAHRFVRFAYTTDDESIELGIERIGRALAAWGR